jgi:hypothetical protein
VGRLPVHWRLCLGTVGLVALPCFPYRAVFQALPARRPALPGLAQGLRVLLGEKERSRGRQDVRSRSPAGVTRLSAEGGKAPTEGIHASTRSASSVGRAVPVCLFVPKASQAALGLGLSWHRQRLLMGP